MSYIYNQVTSRDATISTLNTTIASKPTVSTSTTSWSTNGASNYSVTGPGMVVYTQNVTVLTLDGVSRLSDNSKGLVMLPFASTAVISGVAHGIYTTSSVSALSIPSNSTKTITSNSYASTPFSSRTDTITTGNGFLWGIETSLSFSGSGPGNNSSDGAGNIWLYNNGRLLFQRSGYCNGQNGSSYSGGGGVQITSLLFPFTGGLTVTLGQGSTGSNTTVTCSYSVIWSTSI